jgi:hypothetical protein
MKVILETRREHVGIYVFIINYERPTLLQCHFVIAEGMV